MRQVHHMAEGVTIVDDFVPSGAQGSDSRHTTGSVSITDGNVDIAFTASVNQPKVSAIEVVSAG